MPMAAQLSNPIITDGCAEDDDDDELDTNCKLRTRTAGQAKRRGGCSRLALSFRQESRSDSQRGFQSEKGDGQPEQAKRRGGRSCRSRRCGTRSWTSTSGSRSGKMGTRLKTPAAKSVTAGRNLARPRCGGGSRCSFGATAGTLRT